MHGSHTWSQSHLNKELSSVLSKPTAQRCVLCSLSPTTHSAPTLKRSALCSFDTIFTVHTHFKKVGTFLLYLCVHCPRPLRKGLYCVLLSSTILLPTPTLQRSALCSFLTNLTVSAHFTKICASCVISIIFFHCPPTPVRGL